MKQKKQKGKSNLYLVWVFVAVALVAVYFMAVSSVTSRFDHNANNTIDQKEFSIAMGLLFDWIDTDRDRKIFKPEADRFLEKAGRNIENNVAMFLQFKKFDEDQNRYLSKEEATASTRMREMFKILDKNGDGEIEASETGSKLMGKYLFE